MLTTEWAKFHKLLDFSSMLSFLRFANFLPEFIGLLSVKTTKLAKKIMLAREHSAEKTT